MKLFCVQIEKQIMCLTLFHRKVGLPIINHIDIGELNDGNDLRPEIEKVEGCYRQCDK